MSGYGTPFEESELILAVQSGDIDEAYEMLKNMSPIALYQLGKAAKELHDMCLDVARFKAKQR